MKYIFLINSFSLKNNTQKIVDKVNQYCKKNKLDYKVEVNSLDYTTEDILKKYEKKEHTIICFGGDGTINRTLNGIVNTKNILGYVPYGTGNDFYRTNKEILKNGVNEVDLVRINDKYFINTACFGIDADIANTENLIHSKMIPKSQRYNVSIVKNLFAYKFRHLIIDTDKQQYEDDYTTVVLCNGRYYGGGFKIGKSAKLDDGLLDVYLARKTSKIKMVKILLSIKKGKHELDPSVKKICVNKLCIRSRVPVKCNIDGEILEANTFDVELKPKGIKVYYNQELIDEILS